MSSQRDSYPIYRVRRSKSFSPLGKATVALLFYDFVTRVEGLPKKAAARLFQTALIDTGVGPVMAWVGWLLARTTSNDE